MDAHSSARFATPTTDPALLAFVKCHVSSFNRWEVLRALAPVRGEGIDPVSLAQHLHRPLDAVRRVLDELVDEAVVQRFTGTSGQDLYRLDPAEPSTLVLHRLLDALVRDQELRQLLVSRILHSSRPD